MCSCPTAVFLCIVAAVVASALDDPDCSRPIWLAGYSCQDKPGYIDPHGWACWDWSNNCHGATVAWNYTQEEEDELIRNCPDACGICECSDTAGYVDAIGNSCPDYSGNCIGAAAGLGYNQSVEDDIVRNCPTACGVCFCWQGCFFPGRDDAILAATQHLRDANQALAPSLKLASGAGWLSEKLTNILIKMFSEELLAITMETVEEGAWWTPLDNIASGIVDVHIELWPWQWRDGESKPSTVELFEIGYHGNEGIYFAGVRSVDCGLSNSTLCSPCTTQDTSAGTCAEQWLALEHFRSHSMSRAFDFFPPPGYFHIHTSRIWNYPGALNIHPLGFKTGDCYVPRHCSLAQNRTNSNCMEMLSAAAYEELEKLIEKTRFPYQVLYVNESTLPDLVEQRLASGGGAVFQFWEPHPFLTKVQATKVAFPFPLSSCGDPENGFGFAIGCESPQTPLKNVVSTRIRESAPAFYHAISAPLRISTTVLEVMMGSHTDGGGVLTDTRQVVCEWMHDHTGEVLAWLPLNCSADDDLLIGADGSTLCCRGDARRLTKSGPLVCVPRCDKTLDVPSVSAGRCIAPCPFGSARASPDDKCELCPAGSNFESVPDPLLTGVTTACQICPSGTFSSLSGSLSCNICHPGTFAIENSTRCLPCPSGTDPGEPGQSSCPCAHGFHADGGRAGMGEGCDPCSGSGQTTRFSASASEQDCICNSSYYAKTLMASPDSGADLPHLECQACMRGLECVGGIDEPAQIAGYYIQVLDLLSRSYSAYRCRSALECPAGSIGTCAHGRTGLACAACLAAHYPTKQGTCGKCQTGDFVPLLFGAAGGIALLTIVAAFTNRDMAAQRLTSATVACIAGQLTSALQNLGIFQFLAVTWQEPVLSLLSVVSIFALDLDVLKIACMINDDAVILSFVMKLLLLPVFAGILGVVMLILARAGHGGETPLDRYANTNGSVLLITYLSMMMFVLLPFTCLPSPNGSESMASNPGIVCWQGQHLTLAAMGLVGLLQYPVLTFSIVLWATLRYSAVVASGRSAALLRRYRWLLNRFKADRYYFGLVYLIRAALLSLVPVAFPGKHAEQVLAISTLLVSYSGMQALMWPWRADVANYVDFSVNLGLILLVIAAAFLAPKADTDDESHGAIQGFLYIGVILTLVSFAVAFMFLVYSVYKRARPGTAYQAFLCHHKAGSGALARYLKCSLVCDVSRVFLDSDNLVDLDTLFDIVRADTRTLVILGTRDVCRRMWCAGEITTAMVNQVHVVMVKCDDYREPAEVMDELEHAWDNAQIHTLTAQGITISRIQSAYRQLGSCDALVYSRFAPGSEQHLVIERLALMCGVSSRLPQVSGTSTVSTEFSAKAEFGVVTGHPQNAESISTCQVLCHLMQQHIGTIVAMALSAASYRHLSGGATLPLIIVMTSDLLREFEFAKLLMAACEQEASLNPVNVDNAFEFPGFSFCEQVHREGLRRPELGPDQGPELAEAYQALLKSLALPLSPQASLALLSQQTHEICSRVARRVRDRAQNEGINSISARAMRSAPVSATRSAPLAQPPACEDAFALEEELGTLDTARHKI